MKNLLFIGIFALSLLVSANPVHALTSQPGTVSPSASPQTDISSSQGASVDTSVGRDIAPTPQTSPFLANRDPFSVNEALPDQTDVNARAQGDAVGNANVAPNHNQTGNMSSASGADPSTSSS